MIELLRRIVPTTLLVAAAVAATSASAMVPASPGSGRSGGGTPSSAASGPAAGLASAAAVVTSSRSHRASHAGPAHVGKPGHHPNKHHKHHPSTEKTSPLAAPSAASLLLGETNIEPGFASLPAGTAEAFKLRAVASGSARVLHLYLREANAASTITAGVYSEANGHPGTLLSTGAARAPHGRAWASVPITGLTLVSGRSYWLAILGAGGALRFRDRSEGSCPSQASAQRPLGALPKRWGSGSGHRSCPLSAFLGAPPEPIAAPTVSGASSEGQTLSASHGSWSGAPTGFTYQWQQCAAGGEGCSNVAGATAPHYALSSSNVGHRLRVVVVASNENGSGTANSSLTEAVASPSPRPPAVQPPTNQTPPAVSGTAVQEAVLQASPGSWTGAPTSYSYQWQACNALGVSCMDIAAASTSSYQLAPADVGGTVRVVVDASNAGGSGSAPSAASAVVLPLAPAVIVAPAVTGSVIEGETLSSSAGSWSHSPSSFGYQWQRCTAKGEQCADVAGAASTTYKLSSADVGRTLRVKVTATNAAGAASALSPVTAVVQSGGSESAVLVGSSTLQGSGDTSAAGHAEAFQYAAASSGTVNTISLYVNSGDTAPSIVVGIYANGSGNPGALLASGVISSPKTGAWNTVSIPALTIASGSVYWLAALAPSGVLAIRDVVSGGAPTKTSASGSLKELPSSWSSGASWANSPASFYASGSQQSPPPPPPPSPPENTVPPAISGLPLVGLALTASHGSWTESPTSYRYQWQHCDAHGEACVDVAGALASVYALLLADEGATVRVAVTAENSSGSATAQSQPTGLIGPEVTEREKKEAEERAAKEKAEREKKEAEERAAKEKAEREKKEAEERAAKEKAEREKKEAEERAAKEKAEREKKEAEERAAKEKAEREAKEAEEHGEAACTVTVTTGTALGTIDSDVAEAANKAVVCLAEGSYGSLSINGSSASRTEYATVRAVAGKTVTVAGVKLRSAHFLAFEHLHFSDEANIEDESGRPANTDLRFAHDSWEHVNAGVFMETNSGPNIKRVAIEHDRFVSLLTENGKGCGSGKDGGQGVTNHGAEGLVVAYNLFKEISFHYIQGGSPGPEGMRVEYNTFLGPEPQVSCEHHDNVWQIWQGGENNSFSHNLVLGESHASPQTNPIDLIFENGAGGSECGVKMKGFFVENNLFVYGTGSANIVQAGEIENYNVRHNTGVKFGAGWQGYDNACPHGVNHTQTNNIMVEGEVGGAEKDGFDGFTCTSGTCLFDENISSDSLSACENLSLHCLDAWKPSWKTTTFANPETQLCPPEGYYQPKEEFTASNNAKFSAGYEGRVGACQGTAGA